MCRLCVFYYYLKHHYADHNYVGIYAGLLENFRHMGLSRFTTIVTTCRVALMDILLVAFSHSAIIQTVIVMVLNVMVFAWFLIVKPGETLARNIICYAKETIVLFVNIIYIILANTTTTDDSFAYMIIGGMLAVYTVDVVMGIINIFMTIVNWVVQYRLNAELAKTHPMKELNSSAEKPVMLSAKTTCSKPDSERSLDSGNEGGTMVVFKGSRKKVMTVIDPNEE